MALADHLLDQAGRLVTLETGRPRQASLRRAASTAYYALFHFLIEEACRSMLGSGASSRALRGILSRAFDHSAMRRASGGFASGMLPAALQAGLGRAAVPAELRRVAETFRILQGRRHAADYDLLQRFDRRQVRLLIRQADQAMRLWPAVRDTPAGRLYLLALLVGDRVRE